MKHGITGFLALFSILVLSPARTFAQAATDTPSTSSLTLPEPRLLREGDRAPFTGQLILQSDLLQWAMRIEALEHRLELDVRTERERCDVHLELERARTTAATATTELHDALYQARMQELTTALAEARRSAVREPWEHPALWFAIGAVVAAGAGIGFAAAL